MKWKIAFIISAALFAAAFTVAYGGFQDILSVTSSISTGDVNIGIREYQMVGRKETVYKNSRAVMPGDTVSKIPRIHNYAQPCWVRAKITFSGLEDMEVGHMEGVVRGIPREWVKRGEYYYYTKILGKRDSVDIFRSLYIPSSWDKRFQEKGFTVNVHADAIQAANFQPDFQAMSPWKDHVIQQCIHEENDKICCVKENIRLSVEFRGDVYRLMSVPDDFFSNFGRAMPGDVLKDSISISNTTDSRAEILFCTGMESLTEEQMELLERIGLELYLDGQCFYSGDLKAAGLRENISLGKFAPGESASLDFRLNIPAELDNSYALRDTAVNWIFSVKDEAGNSSENVFDPEYHQEDKGKALAVKTGDETVPHVYIVMILSALIVLAVVYSRKGGKKS